MPFLSVVPANLGVIPDTVANFLRLQGWKIGVPHYNGQPDIYPNLTTTIPWKLQMLYDFYGELKMTMTPVGGEPGFSCTLWGPKLDTNQSMYPFPQLGNDPFVPAGTATRLFVMCSAGNVASPWAAIIIQLGNSYRQMYIGNAEKLGGYSGGVIVSSCNGPTLQFDGPINYRDPAHFNYLFSGRTTKLVADNATGGMNIVHADNSVSWRAFKAPSGNLADLTNQSVIGGFGDGINDGLLSKAQNQFESGWFDVPVNLYAPVTVSGQQKFRPLGRPAGVRTVNMSNKEPGSEIEIGGEKYRVFPALRKSSIKNLAKGVNNWRLQDSSFNVGYAYRIV